MLSPNSKNYNSLLGSKYLSESGLANPIVPVHSDSSVQSHSNFSQKNVNFASSFKRITDFKTDHSRSLDELRNSSNAPKIFVSSIVISLKELIKKVNL